MQQSLCVMADQVACMHQEEAICHHIWRLAPHRFHVGFYRTLTLLDIAAQQVLGERAIM
jgi:hypothetical protein